MNDEASFVYVSKEGDYRRSTLFTEDNIYIYEGNENPLTSSRIYNVEFICDYYLLYYPFDTQTCRMDFRMKGDFGSIVDLNPGKASSSKVNRNEDIRTCTVSLGNLTYSGPVDLTVYFIRDYKMETWDLNDGTKGVTIQIRLGRRLLGIVLTTYLPTFLLLIIVNSTHYFKAFYFEAIVTTNVTGESFFLHSICRIIN